MEQFYTICRRFGKLEHNLMTMRHVHIVVADYKTH